MALTRKLRVGDRFRFPPHGRSRGFTGTVTETTNTGIIWYRDDATGHSSCFISYFMTNGAKEITEYNQLAEHVEDDT